MAEQTAERERAAHHRAYETIRKITTYASVEGLHKRYSNEEVLIAWNLEDLPIEMDYAVFVLVEFALQYHDSLAASLTETRSGRELRAAMHAHAAEIRNAHQLYLAAAKDRQAAVALWERIVADAPGDAKARGTLRGAYVKLAQVLQRGKNHEQAMPYWAKAAALSSPEDSGFEYQRARGLAISGQVDDSLAAIETLAGRGGVDSYAAACVVGRAAAARQGNADQHEALAARAVRLLKADIEVGRGIDEKWIYLKLDPDFDSIRDRPGFQAVYAEAVSKYRRAKGLPELAPPPREVLR